MDDTSMPLCFQNITSEKNNLEQNIGPKQETLDFLMEFAAVYGSTRNGATNLNADFILN